MAAVFKVFMQNKTMRISHARYFKKSKHKIVDNYSSYLKPKLKNTENKPNNKDSKVYTGVYSVRTIKTISTTLKMLLNPVPFSDRPVWTSIHTHRQHVSLPYPGLDTQSDQRLIGEPLQQTRCGCCIPGLWLLPWYSSWEVPAVFVQVCYWSFLTCCPPSVLLVFVEIGVLMGWLIFCDGHQNRWVRLVFGFTCRHCSSVLLCVCSLESFTCNLTAVLTQRLTFGIKPRNL